MHGSNKDADLGTADSGSGEQVQDFLKQCGMSTDKMPISADKWTIDRKAVRVGQSVGARPKWEVITQATPRAAP